MAGAMTNRADSPPRMVESRSAGRLRSVTETFLIHRLVGVIHAPQGPIIVALHTDSLRLASVFAFNWRKGPDSAIPDVTLEAFEGSPGRYGLDDSWDKARWWSSGERRMVAFRCDTYTLVKVCIRGLCSAITGLESLCLHGCVFRLAYRDIELGMAIVGSSGAGKTTLVSQLLSDPECHLQVVNDDWGIMDLNSCIAEKTGEDGLHMKIDSVNAIRPDFFQNEPLGSYIPDASEPDRRIVARPDRVYKNSWSPAGQRIDALAIVIRKDHSWSPPRETCDVLGLIREGVYSNYFQGQERFLNGSLFLQDSFQVRREESRFNSLLSRVNLHWINNCGTVSELRRKFLDSIVNRGPA